MPIDLKEYFPDHYSDLALHVMPLEFSGKMKIFEFGAIEDHDKVSGSIVNPYRLNVARNFDHSNGLAREIGFIKIDEAFKDGIWSGCYYLKKQIFDLFQSKRFEKEVDTGFLIEEF